MHLRHLIVLIINARNGSASRRPCVVGHLIGQIKLTRIHVALLYLRGVRVKRYNKPSLYDVDRSGRLVPKDNRQPNLLFFCDVMYSVEAGSGGADRDRTDDLKLAKLPLSQLSYGPNPSSEVGRPGQTRTADLTLIRRAL
jgi:hypothetical protein